MALHKALARSAAHMVTDSSPNPTLLALEGPLTWLPANLACQPCLTCVPALRQVVDGSAIACLPTLPAPNLACHHVYRRMPALP